MTTATGLLSEFILDSFISDIGQYWICCDPTVEFTNL